MAMDSLASAAHAAGFAMVPEDDVASVDYKSVTHKASVHATAAGRTVVLSDNTARWQGSSQPLADVNDGTRSNGIFDWMPNFSWRADGR
jgi:hypothetical protein